MISNQPKTPLLVLARLQSIVGVAKAAIGLRIGAAARDHVAHGCKRKGEHGCTSQAAIGEGR